MRSRERSPHHLASLDWLTSVLNGNRRVALPWLSLSAFLRIPIEHGLNVYSADTDFARFSEVDWVNPLA